MLPHARFWLAGAALAVLCAPLLAQEQQQEKKEEIAIPAPKLPPPPAATAVAATVNGQPIPEIAVYRALTRVHPSMWESARKEVLGYLIENKLIDQYLERLKVAIDQAEIEKRMAQVREEIKKEGQEYETLLKSLYLTEDELREQIVGALRWDKFSEDHIKDEDLKKLFDSSKNMFDGSLVKAKHLLIKPAAATKEAAAAAGARAASAKKQIEAYVAAEVAKLPAGSDKLTVEKERRRILEETFANAAKQASDCPSKKDGGELGWFPRLGKMVEPFAAAAFAVEPYQMTEPVETEFGYHVIMITETKPGRDVTFDQVKFFVKEVYAERLREAVLTRMRPLSKVEVRNGAEQK